jgi:hypothetical protein
VVGIDVGEQFVGLLPELISTSVLRGHDRPIGVSGPSACGELRA